MDLFGYCKELSIAIRYTLMIEARFLIKKSHVDGEMKLCIVTESHTSLDNTVVYVLRYPEKVNNQITKDIVEGNRTTR